MLGPSLERLAVATHGYTVTGSTVLYDGGGAASAMWEQHVVAGLSILLGVRAALRTRSDDIVVHGPDGDWVVLSVSPFRLSASAGISWQFF